MTKVAVAQTGSVLFDTPKTMARLRAMCDRAKRHQAELVVFPEAFIGGYPKGASFGAHVGTRSRQGRDDFLRYWSSAIDVPGPETDEIGQCAADLGAVLVVGVIERDRGTLYCTALYFGKDGRILGKHRKLMPTASERLIWGFGDGSTIAVMDTAVGRLGAAICWENYMPAFRSAMYAQNIQIWCAPTVDEREIWQASMRHIAYEGRCFVLSACQVLRRADCPDDYECHAGNEPDTVLIRGGSVIASPLGDVLAGPVYDEEVLLTAEIDLAECVRGKYDLDVTGHYARPDIFQLRVNTRAHPAVAFATDAGMTG